MGYPEDSARKSGWEFISNWQPSIVDAQPICEGVGGSGQGLAMKFTLRGIGLGAVVGISLGSSAAFAIRPPVEGAVIMGLIVGTGGAVVGAIAGGVADILAFLRQALNIPSEHDKLEMDYRDSTQAPPE